jgi:hypothetical protein
MHPAALLVILLAGTVYAQGELRIREFDYDQPGADTAEWIEIQNTQDTEFFLWNTYLVLYDGDPGGQCAECRVDVSPLLFLDAGQRIVCGRRLAVCQVKNGARGDKLPRTPRQFDLSAHACVEEDPARR